MRPPIQLQLTTSGCVSTPTKMLKPISILLLSCAVAIGAAGPPPLIRNLYTTNTPSFLDLTNQWGFIPATNGAAATLVSAGISNQWRLDATNAATSAAATASAAVTNSPVPSALYATNSGIIFNANKLPYTFGFLATNYTANLARPGPLRVLLIGDSLNDQKRATYIEAFAELFGVATRGFDLAPTLAGGAYGTNDYTKFFALFHVVPNGGSVIYDANTVVGVLASRVELYYLAESGAGTFDIAVSTDGSAFTNAVTGINSDNGGALSVEVSSFTVFAGYSRIRVTTTSGTVRVLPANAIADTWGRSVNVANLSVGGTGFESFTNVPALVVSNFANRYKPHITITEETSDAGVWSAGGALFLGRLLSGWSKTDQIIVGPHTLTPASAQATNAEQTAVMKALCLSSNWLFIDQVSLFGGRDVMTNAGFVVDATHISDSGRSFAVAHLLYSSMLSAMAGREMHNNPLINLSQQNSDSAPGYHKLGTGGGASLFSISDQVGGTSGVFFQDWRGTRWGGISATAAGGVLLQYGSSSSTGFTVRNNGECWAASYVKVGNLTGTATELVGTGDSGYLYTLLIGPGLTLAGDTLSPSGLSTTIDVLIAGGTTNRLVFTNGVLLSKTAIP